MFVNDTATTEIYTLSLHDALPIFHACTVRLRPQLRIRSHRKCRTSYNANRRRRRSRASAKALSPARSSSRRPSCRSEEHTPELQSRQYLVCRILLEKTTTYDSRTL